MILSEILDCSDTGSGLSLLGLPAEEVPLSSAAKDTIQTHVLMPLYRRRRSGPTTVDLGARRIARKDRPLTTLLLASTGGHLAQLYQLQRRMVDPNEPVVWVTFDSPQSRSMLA